MLKSKKHVFWEALIATIAIFLVGLFLGMLIESGNISKINNLYIQSEISLVDGMTSSNFIGELGLTCEELKKSNIDFADKIYEEAKILEELESSGKLTDGMKYLHKKYDLLRVLLWINNQKLLSECDNYDLVVYLYEYNTEDNNKKAIQNVWSKVLLELKLEDENVLLIPIAADQDLESLNLMMREYNVSSLPALVINGEKVIYEVESASKLKLVLN